MPARFALRSVAATVASAAAVLLVACSGSTTSSDPGSSSGVPTAQPSGTTTAPTTPPPVSTADAGTDSAASTPDPLPPFELTIDGKARTLATITTQLMSPGGIACKNEIRVNAVLVPEGAEEPSPAPNLDVDVCVSLLPASNDLAYGDWTDGLAQAVFNFQLPGSAHFPSAEGPGMHIVQDGTKGVFEASGTGTLEIENGMPKAFTLKIRQPVTQ
jgi:hypothetical protein